MNSACLDLVGWYERAIGLERLFRIGRAAALLPGQVCESGFRWRTIYLPTLVSPKSMPSLRSSPWLRGAPQTCCRGSFAESVFGSPSAPQGVRVALGGPSNSRTGGILCGARQSPYPVLRCRVPSATRSMFHKARATVSGRTGPVSASSRSVAKRKADGEAQGSQAAMPLEFGKATTLAAKNADNTAEGQI